MRNLFSVLRARSLDELRRIAACWDVPLTGQTTADFAAQLYRALREPWTVRDRAAALAAAEWAIIEALVEAAATPADLAARAGIAATDATTAIATLRACGIVVSDEGESEQVEALALPRELATAFERLRDERLLGATLGPETPLRALLTTLEGGELEEAAEAWGVRVTPGAIGRDALTDEILARVDLPDQRRAIVATLPPAAARVFAALRAAQGRLALTDLREQVDLPPAALREALRLLARRLLVWHRWSAGARELFVPRDVLAPRRPPRDAPPTLTPIAAAPPDRAQALFEAAWDLLTILRRLTLNTLEWREGDEERNATALRRLAPALWTTSGERVRPGYVPFLLALARDAGLVHLADERYEVTAAADAWRNLSFAEQTRALFTRWRAAVGWLEGLSQDDLQLTGVSWPAARAALLEELRACPPGAWFDATTLATRIARLRPALLSGSFSAARASGPAGTREEVTIAAVRVALHGGLTPLGVLAEGRSPDGALALALTDLGAWLLGSGAEPAPRPVGDRPLAVGADFEVLLFRPTPRRLWALGAIAELVRLDTVCVYRLTEAAIRRALGTGLTIEQIESFLTRASRAPLPQPVAFALRDWTRGQAGIQLTRTLVLRLTDPAAADRLRSVLARAGLPEPESLPEQRFLLGLPDEPALTALLEALRETGFLLHWSRESGGVPVATR
ncbi:MAG: helicase-associated domain-containing protein [Thermomicrobiales bacterium]